MSPLGQQRTWRLQFSMSALRSIADMNDIGATELGVGQ
jgi:hypothetical protein